MALPIITPSQPISNNCGNSSNFEIPPEAMSFIDYSLCSE
jgi:hypothetical protein